MFSITADRLFEDLEALARFGASEGGGITRRAYAPAYQDASRWLCDRMDAAGLKARVDAVGNVIGRLGPDDGPAVLSGSHIDTVPNGGRYDGAYGVLAALECARTLKEQGAALDHALEVVAFVDEEGAYLNLLGSRAMTGALRADELSRARSEDGVTLLEAMRAAGLDPPRAPEAGRPPADFHCYVELHIEQGPVLERASVPIGIVEGIVGILEVDYTFRGEAGHAGTTPMDLRHDALRSAADFITRTYVKLPPRLDASARVTFGSLTVEPNASNVIPEEVRLRQELRDLSPERLNALFEESREIAAAVAREQTVHLSVSKASFDAPARMSERVAGRIEEACDRLGLTSRRMSSGAGHDAQVLAGVCDTGMIFVPSHKGQSHRADEWTDPKDLERGANLLLHALTALAD
ncbi:MAG: Zn-dependent hydrolase [Proteobacteria bacterium]|nr:Zn-dependent hydrolase [Pseudomonadota bacterium]